TVRQVSSSRRQTQRPSLGTSSGCSSIPEPLGGLAKPRGPACAPCSNLLSCAASSSKPMLGCSDFRTKRQRPAPVAGRHLIFRNRQKPVLAEPTEVEAEPDDGSLRPRVSHLSYERECRSTSARVPEFAL